MYSPYNTLLVRPEATSLLGTPLYRPGLPLETRGKLEAEYMKAKSDYDAHPDNVENIIWLGRRLAYLWRYRDAIDLFSKGIKTFPKDPRLYRHRGHRFITVREFDNAVRDLTKAAELVKDRPDEVEPDGQPNPMNIPTSTLKSNIWYHLGLAYYLKGKFHDALAAYLECMRYSTNDDMLCATSDWLYMTYRRLGRAAEARAVLEGIRKEMNILENFSYHKRLLMYKSERPPDSLLNPAGASDLDLATQGYGVGNWFLYGGNQARATEIFRRVLEGTYWAAFGFIAAEADFHRLQSEKP